MEALRDNPEARVYEAEIASAQGALYSAGKWSNPELGVSYGQKSVSGTDDDENGPSWSVSLSQTIEWPGRLDMQRALATHDLEAAELGLQQFHRTLAIHVKTAAQTLAIAHEKERIIRNLAQKMKTLRENLAQRPSAGIVQELELRLVEASEQELRKNVLDASRQSQAAMQELNTLCGRPPLTPVIIKIDYPPLNPLPPDEVLVASALTNSLDMRFQDIQIKRAMSQVELANHERYPSIGIEPFYEEEDAGELERTFGLGVSIPLPLWNRNRGNVMSANAGRLQVESAHDLARRDIESRVLSVAADYQARLAELELWEPDKLVQYRDSADTAERHYLMGSVPLNLCIEMMERYGEAAIAWLEAVSSAIHSQYELELLTGMTLVTEDTKEVKP